MKYLKEDIKAKTKSFFLNGNKDFFTEKYIDFIKNFYLKFKKDVRICLHKDNKSKHHDMIILQQKKLSKFLRLYLWHIYLVLLMM